MEKINIGIIGVGGYGTTHLKSIDYWEAAGLCHLKAAVIRNQDKYNEQEKKKFRVSHHCLQTPCLTLVKGIDKRDASIASDLP